ncbi:unnamed protein product, partial [Nesidiocoris tenuis]
MAIPYRLPRTYSFVFTELPWYFQSVTMLTKMNQVEAKIRSEIGSLHQAMDALHWKIKLHEQQRAYERQATLDWFKHKKEQEEKLMKHLS